VKTKKFNLAIFFAINIAGISLSVLGGVLYYNIELSSTTLSDYAETLGMISSIGMILQWAPQIFTTVKNKSAGNLSLLMLCIQMPGALLVVFFQGFLNHAHYTTWFPYTFSALQMMILIILILVFWIRDKKRKAPSTEFEPLIQDEDIGY